MPLIRSYLAFTVLFAAIVSGQDSANADVLPTPTVTNVGTSTATGPWQISPSFFSIVGWLAANLTNFTGNSEDVSVDFKAPIRTNADYTVSIYTPGCVQENSCVDRGSVNLIGYYIIGNDSEARIQIAQTNKYDKYDTIYQGPINASSDTFSPKVHLAALPGAKSLVVAQRARFLQNGLLGTDPLDVLAQNATINTDLSKVTASRSLSHSVSPTSGSSGATTTGSNTAGTSPSPTGNSGGLSQGAKIGIGVGVSLGVLLLCALVALVIVCYRLLQARNPQGGGLLLRGSRRSHHKPELMNTEKPMHELSSTNRGKDPQELMSEQNEGDKGRRHELPNSEDS